MKNNNFKIVSPVALAAVLVEAIEENKLEEFNG